VEDEARWRNARPSVGRLRGTLRCVDGRYFADDLGAVSPRGFHFGEIFSIWLRDPVRARALLRQVLAAGFDFVRPWFTLNVGNRFDSYWVGRDCGPKFWPTYYTEVQAFLEFCALIGLRVQFSFGDLKSFNDAEENALFDGIADIFDRSPLAKSAVILFEGLNEARDTGDRDDKEPQEIERLVNRVRTRHPDLLYALSAYTGHEDAETLRAWTPSWMRFILVHSYRAGTLSDKIRHLMNECYELAKAVREGLRISWRGEPCGTGKYVSATDNTHEMLDPQAMHLYCLAQNLGPGSVMYFSSVGVICDEPLEAMAGFDSVCALLDLLPRGIGAWDRLFHGGASNRGTRIYAVPGTDETRCDHVLDTATGEFAVIQHGPRWRECYAERAHSVTRIIDCGAWGRIILGRI